VTRLLEEHFPQLVDYGFTAQMEQQLDDISNGQVERLPYLQHFYSSATGLDSQVRDREGSIDPRTACTLELSGLGPKVRVGRYGPFLETERDGQTVTASIPADIAPSDVSNELAEQLILQKQTGPQSLGVDPESQLQIFLLNGPFGPYLQVGEVREGEAKPRRVSIPKTRDLTTLNLDDCLSYLALPRTLGSHPETGKVVKAGIGMYGPYVLHEKTYKSLGKEDDVLSIEMPRAVELLSQAKKKVEIVPLKDLGKHPADDQPVGVFEGRYGAYVKHGKVNATIPKDKDPTQMTLEEAIPLLEERAAKGGGKGKASRRKTVGVKAASSSAAPKKKKAAAKKKKPAAD
jgi:DNA topoisomerase-1